MGRGFNWSRPVHRYRGRQFERADGGDVPREFYRAEKIRPQRKAKADARSETRAKKRPTLIDIKRKAYGLILWRNAKRMQGDVE